MTVCAQTAGITYGALCASVSLSGPRSVDGTTDTGNGLLGRQIGSCGFPRPILSHVVRRDVRHTYGCAAPTRGGLCDCGAIPTSAWTSVWVPDLRTTSRGLTYDLAAMLDEAS